MRKRHGAQAAQCVLGCLMACLPHRNFGQNPKKKWFQPLPPVLANNTHLVAKPHGNTADQHALRLWSRARAGSLCQDELTTAQSAGLFHRRPSAAA